MTELTKRQQRELDYHRERAKLHQSLLTSPFSWDVLRRCDRPWWNAYWAMYEYFLNSDMKGRTVLVVGCGFGDDALRLAKLGAKVSAFDLCPDSLAIAKALALREGLDIRFEQMPAEKMSYENNYFDYILARDILHHVDIPSTMGEIVRVAKPNAIFLVNEIYSHSLTNRIRHSALVERVLYPKMRGSIYGAEQPYITKDERKLSESDLKHIMAPLRKRQFTMYFNFLVLRVISDRFEGLAKLDRLLLRMLHPIGPLLAGRVLFAAAVLKPARGSDV